MQKRILIFFLFLSVLVLQGCATKENNSLNISDYGLWDNSTKNIIENQFNYSLPNSQVVDSYGTAYYYRSKQAVFGDINFVIYVSLQFENKENYINELNKYVPHLSDSILKKTDATHYIIQGSSESAMEYLDDSIYDGMFYNFEIISIDDANYSISFINARVWDYYADLFLIDCLQRVYNT